MNINMQIFMGQGKNTIVFIAKKNGPVVSEPALVNKTAICPTNGRQCLQAPEPFFHSFRPSLPNPGSVKLLKDLLLLLL